MLGLGQQWASGLVDAYMQVFGRVDDRTHDELMAAAAVEGELQFDWEHGYTTLVSLREGAIQVNVVSRHYGATVYWGEGHAYALALAGESWLTGEGVEVIAARSGHAGTLLEVMQVLAEMEVEFGLEDD